MPQGSEGGRPPSEQVRQVTIDALMEAFANDVMDVEEFERRVDVAHKATTPAELEALLEDLPRGRELPATREGSAGSELVGAREYTVTPGVEREDSAYVVAMLGGSSRRGRWTPAKKNYAVAVMGGAELDFREAIFARGVTEVHVYAMWGGVDIIVPPGINVESRGIALLGGFDHSADSVSDRKSVV